MTRSLTVCSVALMLAATVKVVDFPANPTPAGSLQIKVLPRDLILNDNVEPRSRRSK